MYALGSSRLSSFRVGSRIEVAKVCVLTNVSCEMRIQCVIVKFTTEINCVDSRPMHCNATEFSKVVDDTKYSKY